MSLNHKPRRGDKVNDRRRGPYRSNGFVICVLYDDGPSEVLCSFPNKEGRPETEYYDFSEFEFSWTDSFGGVFELSHHRRMAMTTKVRVTIEYEYEGDEEDAADIAKTEREAWVSGGVDYSDIVAAGDHDLKVEVIEVVDTAEEVE